MRLIAYDKYVEVKQTKEVYEMELLTKFSVAVREVIGEGTDARNIDARILMVLVQAGLFSLNKAPSSNSYNLYLSSVNGDKKINCLKALRYCGRDWGLKEAKDFMDGVLASKDPGLFMTVNSLEEALRLRDVFSQDGSVVTIREEVLLA